MGQNASLIKWYTQVPHLIDDMELDPVSFRLYVHLCRVGNPCKQSTKKLAEKCHISTASVSRAKKRLQEAGLITIEVQVEGHYVRHIIIVKDVWRENYDRYSKQSDRYSKKVTGSANGTKENPPEEKFTPTAGDRGPPATFPAWLEQVQQSKNPQAVIVRMIQVLWPDREKTNFGRVVKVQRQVGGYGRLAQLIWLANSYRPTGDILSYCIGLAKGNHAVVQEQRTGKVVIPQ